MSLLYQIVFGEKEGPQRAQGVFSTVAQREHVLTEIKYADLCLPVAIEVPCPIAANETLLVTFENAEVYLNGTKVNNTIQQLPLSFLGEGTPVQDGSALLFTLPTGWLPSLPLYTMKKHTPVKLTLSSGMPFVVWNRLTLLNRPERQRWAEPTGNARMIRLQQVSTYTHSDCSATTIQQAIDWAGDGTGILVETPDIRRNLKGVQFSILDTMGDRLNYSEAGLMVAGQYLSPTVLWIPFEHGMPPFGVHEEYTISHTKISYGTQVFALRFTEPPAYLRLHIITMNNGIHVTKDGTFVNSHLQSLDSTTCRTPVPVATEAPATTSEASTGSWWSLFMSRVGRT